MDIFAKKNHHQRRVSKKGKTLVFCCFHLFSVFWYLHGLDYLNCYDKSIGC